MLGADSVPWGSKADLCFADSGQSIHRRAPPLLGQIGAAGRALNLWQNAEENDSLTPSFLECRMWYWVSPNSSPPLVPGIRRLLFQSRITLVLKGPYTCLPAKIRVPLCGVTDLLKATRKGFRGILE